MALFTHKNYREFLKEHIEKKPKGGRGEWQRLSQELRIHSTLMSQIMSGRRDFTDEQAFELCELLQLTDAESEYFQLLVKIERAHTKKFRDHLESKLSEFRKEVEKVSKRFTKEEGLSETEKSIFYSSWIYSAIRLFCSTQAAGRTLEDVMDYFRLNRQKAHEYLDFLVQSQLCDRIEDKYQMGKQRTYIDRGSIHFLKHHLNWRMKSIDRSEKALPQDKLYTVTMSVSEEGLKKIHEQVSMLINETLKITQNSEPEVLVCMNCDLFTIEP